MTEDNIASRGEATEDNIAPEGGASKDIVAPPGGVMTDEVGAVTGDLTLEPFLDGDSVRLRVQYKGADEWYVVTDTAVPVDPADQASVDRAMQDLLARFN
jgi:hypothetical protein